MSLKKYRVPLLNLWNVSEMDIFELRAEMDAIDRGEKVLLRGRAPILESSTTESQKRSHTMNIIKPTEADLAPLIAEATEKQTLTQWKGKYLAAIGEFLEKNPLRYRAYGPWWWLLKKELIASGNYEFGDDTDAEWVEALDYGRIELNLLAAHGYADWRTDEGAMHEPMHTLELEDGETIDYLLTDTDMEQRALGQQLEQG